MIILHISDTHGKHHQLKDLPPADIIIHSGDGTEDGENEEMLEFLNWFFALDYKYKIFVAGNHDISLDGGKLENIPEHCYYLHHSGVEIEGVKFWGVPHFFFDELDGSTELVLNPIAVDTDILISHRPPLYILDFEDGNHFGCYTLYRSVMNICPRYHLFGHVHASYGIEKSRHTTFINASLFCNDVIKNKPVLIQFENAKIEK